MGRNEGGPPGSHQEALEVALAALRHDADRVGLGRSVALPVIRADRATDDRPAPPPDGDDLVLRHLAFFGSFMTRRLDGIDDRADDLVEALVLLQTTLARFWVSGVPGRSAAPGRRESQV